MSSYILWTIRIATIPLLIATGTALADGQNLRNVKVSLKANHIPLDEALDILEQKTNFRFYYYGNIPVDKKICVHAKSLSLRDVLKQICGQAHVDFQRVDNVIYVRKSKEIQNTILTTSQEESVTQNDREITGKVSDAKTGEPLAGATIQVKGTTKGTVTDADGTFTLSVPENAEVLIVSFLGYLKTEIPLGSQTSFEVYLEQNSATLDDIVVVGYGTQKKTDITSSIVSISSEDLGNQSVVSIDQALVGKVAGVQVIQNSGSPSGGIQIRVRGIGSISAGNDPLYVVDGVPISRQSSFATGANIDPSAVGSTSRYEQPFNPLNTINVNDIESIEILKDAAAAAIYGSRGAKGVVLITTKKGQLGKAKITIDSYYGVQKLLDKVDVLDAYQYAELSQEARNTTYLERINGADINDTNEERLAKGATNSMLIADIFRPYLNGQPGLTNTDWQDEIFRTAAIQSHTLSAAGGTDRVNYFISANYFKQEGILIGTELARYSGRFNIEVKASDKLKFGVNLNPSVANHQLTNAEGPWFDQGVIGSALFMAPVNKVREEDGSFAQPDLSSLNGNDVNDHFNPVAYATLNRDELGHRRILGNLFAEYEIIKNLKYRLSFGTDINDFRRDYFRSSEIPFLISSDPKATSSTETTINWLVEHTISYDFEGNGHNLNILGGFTAQKEKIESNRLLASNFPNDLVTSLNAGTVTGGSSRLDDWSLLSLIGRVQYNYKGKYFAAASLRSDGSSRFGSGNRWGVFPSFSVGWRVSDESFLADNKILSDLKVRGSYGVTGNFDIPNYGSIGLISSANYVTGEGTGSIVNGLAPITPSNESLTWERTETFDVGLDIGLFEDKMYLQADYFVSNTSDLLLNVPLPQASGFSSALQNIGKVQNKGFELVVGVQNKFGGLEWDLNANFSTIENEVKALGVENEPIIVNGNPSSISWITKVGGEIGAYYLPIADGVFLNQEQINTQPHRSDARPGDLQYIDVNGDGEINFANDRAVVGSVIPDYSFGISTSLKYKGVDLTISFQGVQGFEVLNTLRRYVGVNESFGNALTDVYVNRWQSESNPGNGQTPRANRIQSGGQSQISTWHVEDGSYIRLRNITLGYTLPKSWMQAVRLENARFYLSIQNPFQWTDYSLYNPEVNNRPNQALAPGEDYGSYPLATIYTFGTSITF
ncbi:MAG: TonB-dependent receptor [Microscillaceae bacterium]|nr:TonB-dependent receptor [Microscillaceae bacterium]